MFEDRDRTRIGKPDPVAEDGRWAARLPAVPRLGDARDAGPEGTPADWLARGYLPG